MPGRTPSITHLLSVNDHMGTLIVNFWSYAILRLRPPCFLLIETCVLWFCLPAILPFRPTLDRYPRRGIVVCEHGEVVCL
jgi:hypothetical protein